MNGANRAATYFKAVCKINLSCGPVVLPELMTSMSDFDEPFRSIREIKKFCKKKRREHFDTFQKRHRGASCTAKMTYEKIPFSPVENEYIQKKTELKNSENNQNPTGLKEQVNNLWRAINRPIVETRVECHEWKRWCDRMVTKPASYSEKKDPRRINYAVADEICSRMSPPPIRDSDRCRERWKRESSKAFEVIYLEKQKGWLQRVIIDRLKSIWKRIFG